MVGQELDEALTHRARRAEDANFESGFMFHKFTSRCFLFVSMLEFRHLKWMNTCPVAIRLAEECQYANSDPIKLKDGRISLDQRCCRKSG